ncbi:MAG: hypothetical protein J6A79_01145 [Clostridia bacterium]|nr:hypothetical protein [Clostridia bacterium]
MKKKNTTWKAKPRKKYRTLRRRKPRRQGSRSQTGKRLPVWYVLRRKGG